MQLSQDQKDIRDWVHGFALDVVRPAAHEWDEKEQTPWPIIQEAAKIGLYGLEGLAQFFADPTGLTLPIVNEELFWGDAGIGMSIMGTALAVAAIFGQGTGEQIGEWIPRCFGTAERPEGRRLLRVGAERRLGRLQRPHARALRRGHRRVGPQRPEGVGDQRRHLRRPRRDRDRRPRARLARPRRVRRPDERSEGHIAGLEGLKARAARVAHRRRLPRRLPRPGGLRARRQGEARRAPGPRARGCQQPLPGRDADVRGLAPDRRRPGARDRARRL